MRFSVLSRKEPGPESRWIKTHQKLDRFYLKKKYPVPALVHCPSWSLGDWNFLMHMNILKRTNPWKRPGVKNPAQSVNCTVASCKSQSPTTICSVRIMPGHIKCSNAATNGWNLFQTPAGESIWLASVKTTYESKLKSFDLAQTISVISIRFSSSISNTNPLQNRDHDNQLFTL